MFSASTTWRLVYAVPEMSEMGLGRVKTRGERWDFGDAVQVFCRSGYARIAAMSGWIPTMFITRVTL